MLWSVVVSRRVDVETELIRVIELSSVAPPVTASQQSSSTAVPIDWVNVRASIRLFILLACIVSDGAYHRPTYSVVALKRAGCDCCVPVLPVNFSGRPNTVPNWLLVLGFVVVHACPRPSRLPSSCAVIGGASGTRRGPMVGTAW